jgi:hypothetical protein
MANFGFVVVTVETPASAQTDVFRITGLGALREDEHEAIDNRGYRINDNGQVVGVAGPIGYGSQAAVWNNGQVTELGYLPNGDTSIGYAINDQGTIAAYSTGFKVATTEQYLPATYSTTTNTWTNLQLPLPSSSSLTFQFGTPSGISSSGEVVGWLSIENFDSPPRIPFIDSGNGSDRPELLPLNGAIMGDAQAINKNASIVVGEVGYDVNHQVAAAWTSTGLHVLDTFGSGNSASRAQAVNDSGLIVGWRNNASGHQQATIFNGVTATLPFAIPLLPGAVSSESKGVNDQNMIVGRSVSSTGAESATFSVFSGNQLQSYDMNGLQTSGWTLNSANDINVADQIVGRGVDSNGVQEGFVATPILHWSGASAGSWANPNTWTFGLSPTQQNVVDIDGASVTVPSGAYAAAELNVGQNSPATLHLDPAIINIPASGGVWGSGEFVLNSGSSLTGSGAIVASTIHLNGIIVPDSAGSLSFQGSTIMSAAAAVDFSLAGAVAGAQYGQVNVTGGISVNGVLEPIRVPNRLAASIRSAG